LINLNPSVVVRVPQKAALHQQIKEKARVQPRTAMGRKKRIVGMKLRNLMRNR
jgi:hypothetical protein